MSANKTQALITSSRPKQELTKPVANYNFTFHLQEVITVLTFSQLTSRET